MTHKVIRCSLPGIGLIKSIIKFVKPLVEAVMNRIDHIRTLS